MNLKENSQALLNSVLILIGFATTVLLLYLGKLLLVPLFFAFLVALGLYPLNRWLQKHRIPRLISSILCIFLLILVAAIITFFLSSQVQRFLSDIPLLQNKLSELMRQTHAWLETHFGIESNLQSGDMNLVLNNLLSGGKTALSLSLFIIIEATLALFFSFYLLYYRNDLKKFALSFLNQSRRKAVMEIHETVHNTILSYLKGLLIEISILILLSSVALFILGIKYAVLMAFFAGLLNIIPYIGIYIATFLNVLITVATGNETQSLQVLLVFVIIHMIDSNLIVPVVVGGRIKINPMVTLIAIVTGELIWGIPGMFLFIPLTAILNIVFKKVLALNSPETYPVLKQVKK